MQVFSVIVSIGAGGERAAEVRISRWDLIIGGDLGLVLKLAQEITFC